MMSSDAERIAQLELRARSIQEEVQKDREERLQAKASASGVSNAGTEGGGGDTAENPNPNETGRQQSPKNTTLENYDGCGGGCGECCASCWTECEGCRIS